MATRLEARRFALAVALPAVGLLRWHKAILDHRREELAWAVLLPAAIATGSGAVFLMGELIFPLFLAAAGVTLGMFGVYIGQWVRDVQESLLKVDPRPLLVFRGVALLLPLALWWWPLAIVALWARESIANLAWLAIAPIPLPILAALWLGFKAPRPTRWSALLAAVLPAIGLLGIPALIRGRWRFGIGSFVTGLLCLATFALPAFLPLLRYPIAFIIVVLLPVALYVGLWLLGVAENFDEGAAEPSAVMTRPHRSSGRAAMQEVELQNLDGSSVA